MAAGARDLDIVFSRVPADVAAVVLMGWNDATAWHVFARLQLGIRHFISLLSFLFSITLYCLYYIASCLSPW
jgi:hypothetical protein